MQKRWIIWRVKQLQTLKPLLINIITVKEYYNYIDSLINLPQKGVSI